MCERYCSATWGRLPHVKEDIQHEGTTVKLKNGFVRRVSIGALVFLLSATSYVCFGPRVRADQVYLIRGGVKWIRFLPPFDPQQSVFWAVLFDSPSR
jgi:hypothetical protein